MKNLLYSLSLLILSSELYSQSSIVYNPGTSINIGTGADVCADNITINGTYSGTGTICSGVMPVTIISFTSAVNKNNVMLGWSTSEEINNSGFDIERKRENNNWEKISFIPGNGTTNEPKTYIYEDKKLLASSYKYRLKQIDYNGNFEYFGLSSDVFVRPPDKFTVSQNYPNPSNPRSKIDFEIPFTGKVTLKIYDMLGKEVIILINEVKEAGYHTAEFDGSNLSSGVYFYKITASELTVVKKMILVK